MKNKVQVIPAIGLAVLVGYATVQLNGQAAPVPDRDFTNAAIAEVRDAQGRTVLQGKFAQVDEDDDDVERKATLTQTGVDADAVGEAEIEYAKANARKQEIEFSVRNLDAGATVTLVVDGTDVGTAVTNSRGRAEAKVIVRLPGAPPATR